MEKTVTLNGLKKENFETIVNGKKVELFILTNKNGCEVSVTNWGAKIVSINVPDKKGRFWDVVLGKQTIHDYLDDNEPYFGAICGRTANRIANGKFVLNGNEYNLAKNIGSNNLHGGYKGFNSVVWEAKQLDEQTLKLHYFSKNGEEGYPGNLLITVIYRISDLNAVEIEYKAVSDQATIINPTNHSYFNLSGEGDPYIGDHELQINGDSFLPADETAIPFGNPEKVENTPFDFRSPHTIGERINSENTQLLYGNGYDHNFVLNRNGQTGLVCAAKAVSPQTGIVLETYTTEPGMQLYTGNYLNGSFTGKKGHVYPCRSAFCLETQHFPDSINHPEYPSIVLRAGEYFESKTVYQFSNR